MKTPVALIVLASVALTANLAVGQDCKLPNGNVSMASFDKDVKLPFFAKPDASCKRVKVWSAKAGQGEPSDQQCEKSQEGTCYLYRVVSADQAQSMSEDFNVPYIYTDKNGEWITRHVNNTTHLVMLGKFITTKSGLAGLWYRDYGATERYLEFLVKRSETDPAATVESMRRWKSRLKFLQDQRNESKDCPECHVKAADRDIKFGEPNRSPAILEFSKPVAASERGE